MSHHSRLRRLEALLAPKKEWVLAVTFEEWDEIMAGLRPPPPNPVFVLPKVYDSIEGWMDFVKRDQESRGQKEAH